MYNNEFKRIDTEEKAYFLGQAFGDGYNKGTSPYKFSMASINTDIEVYKKLQQIFPFLKLKFYSSHKNMVYLDCHLKEFCQDLANLGLQSNKTKNDENGKFHFPAISKDLMHHFIRGFFDADGSAWYPKRYRSRNNLKIEFGVATPNFLRMLQTVLKEEGILMKFIIRSKRAGNGKFYTSYSLLSSSREISLKFADYIYKDAKIYLQYKHDLCYRTKIDIDNNFELYGACPYCGSSDIIQNGIRKMKKKIMKRLKCHNCNKGFSVPMPS